MLGVVKCSPIPVAEALQLAKSLRGDIVPIHGILYQSNSFAEDEFLLLPKVGPFDGSNLVDAAEQELGEGIRIIDKAIALQLSEHVPPAIGTFRHRYDAIVIGSLEMNDSASVSIHDVILLALQYYDSWGDGKAFHRFYIINFANRIPPLPFNSGIPEGHGFPVLGLAPIEE